MTRKRVTQIFPFLLPIRVWQRNLFNQIGMVFDGNKYAKKRGDLLPYEVCNSKTVMVNENSGYDIIYQENKVDNLKIASKTVNRVLIYPGETLSLCRLLRKSYKYGAYKEGLVLIDNKIVVQKGGGLCHLSNLLYYLFLMSPLTVIERHGHRVKSLPNPDKESLDGIDATINSGWLDLKVRNDTEDVYQIVIDFDDKYMYGKILTSASLQVNYKIINGNLEYFRKDDKVFERVSVVRVISDRKTNEVITEEKLYDEVVLVTYDIPSEIEIINE